MEHHQEDNVQEVLNAVPDRNRMHDVFVEDDDENPPPLIGPRQEGVDRWMALNQAQHELHHNQQQLAAQLQGMGPQVERNMQALWNEIQNARQSARSNVTSMTAKPPKPPMFHGSTKPGERVDNWLFDMQQYCRAVRMPPNAWVEFAATFLRDGASTWWRAHLDLVERSQEQLITEWSQFKTVLTAQFRPVNAQKIARDRLHNLHQTGSVVRYVYEFHEICLEIRDVSPSEKLDRFVRGLKPSIQEKVEMEDPPTVEQAMQIAQRIDSIQWTARKRQSDYVPRKSFKNSYRSSSVKRELNVTKMEPNYYDKPEESDELHAMWNDRRRPGARMSAEERQKCYDDGLCFKCKRPGHMIGECPLNSKFPKKNSNWQNKNSGKGHAQ